MSLSLEQIGLGGEGAGPTRLLGFEGNSRGVRERHAHGVGRGLADSRWRLDEHGQYRSGHTTRT
jgi:hypothetical protein